ncbi:MAG: TolC family protein [Polyangiales bacterium]
MNRRKFLGKTGPRWASWVLIATAGCAGSHEQQVQRNLREVREAGRTGSAEREQLPELEGSLDAYVKYAMLRSPALRASFEQWHAATERISPQRRLPEPTVSYTYFVRNVETRVGPQEHKLGIQQKFPWPTKLTAGAEAQSDEAEAARERFEAQALALEAEVEQLYWRLWAVHRVHDVFNEQEGVLETLEQTVKARVETGQASLADLMQVQLALTRHRDHHGTHMQMIRRMSADLVATIGAPSGTPTPIHTDGPRPGLPAMDEAELREAALAHPRVEAYEYLAQSSDAQVEGEQAERFPSFGVGLDWVLTGEARGAAAPQDSGKDAVMLTVSASVPLWGESYSDAMDAAEAEAAAHRASGDAAARAAEAELEEALSKVRDAQRRIALYSGTLIPQAEAVHEALRGDYQTGRTDLAQLLMSERELLELRDVLVDARADHAIAWAHLEGVVGREIPRREAGGDE